MLVIFTVFSVSGCGGRGAESQTLPADSGIGAITEESDATQSDTVNNQISEFGRQAAAEFLSQYISAFSFGFMAGDGTYRDWLGSAGELDARPLVVYQRIDRDPWVVYYDRQGNRLEDVPFISRDAVVTSFYLYGLDNDGIPTIILRWGVPETCAVSCVVFRFIDGKYREMGSMLSHYNLFRDYAGRLIVLYNSDMDGVYGYYYLRFTDDGMEKEAVAGVMDGWDIGTWWEHHGSPEFAESPTIFGTGAALIPIPRLTDLQDELTDIIRERLLAEN